MVTWGSPILKTPHLLPTAETNQMKRFWIHLRPGSDCQTINATQQSLRLLVYSLAVRQGASRSSSKQKWKWTSMELLCFPPKSIHRKTMVFYGFLPGDSKLLSGNSTISQGISVFFIVLNLLTTYAAWANWWSSLGGIHGNKSPLIYIYIIYKIYTIYIYIYIQPSIVLYSIL